MEIGHYNTYFSGMNIGRIRVEVTVESVRQEKKTYLAMTEHLMTMHAPKKNLNIIQYYNILR